MSDKAEGVVLGAVGGILAVTGFVLGWNRSGGSELQASINNYVAATGNGSITCKFEDASQVTFNQALNQIDPKFRSAVAKALNNGACVASLPKTPKVATTTRNSQPTNG
jgi:hypothetical protein